MKVIKAPDQIPSWDDETCTIFLAGSIEMGKAENWQDTVQKALEPYIGNILNPRRDDWDSSWEQTVENKQFATQVRWEQEGLRRADIIMMYFDPDTKSPITLLEFGQFYDSMRLLVGCPKGFWRRGNLEVVCADNGIPLFDTLNGLIAATVQEIEEQFNK